MNPVYECPNGCWFHSQSSYCECPCHKGKIWGWHLPILLALLLVASNVFASCPDGWVEWPEHSGHCASLAAPKEADVPEVKPSKEKPPSDKMPSWEREGIHVDEAKPCAPNDAKLDQERAQADADGKKAAAIQ